MKYHLKKKNKNYRDFEEEHKKEFLSEALSCSKNLTCMKKKKDIIF